MEILTYLIVAYAGYSLGKTIAIWRMRNVIKEVAESIGFKIDETTGTIIDPDLDSKSGQYYVDNVNGLLLMYEYHSNDFICQARTVEELAKLAQKYKNVNDATVKHDNREIYFVDGDVKLSK